MNKSDKEREERIDTKLAKGYLFKLDTLKETKGLRSRASIIEYLIDKEPSNLEETEEQIDFLNKQIKLSETKINKFKEDIIELNKSKDVFKIKDKIEIDKKEQLYGNLTNILRRMLNNGSSEEEILSKSIQFSTENTLKSMKCVEIGQSVIKEERGFKFNLIEK